MFPRSATPPSSGSKSEINKEQEGSSCQAADMNSFFGLLFDPEDGDDTFLRNVAKFLLTYAELQPRRSYSL
jgi:hypothetical protein